MTSQTIIKVRGVLRDKEKILLCYNKEQNFYFLPGGSLKHQEDAKKCLQRELREECQLDVTVEKFIGCLECHWKEGQNQYQELDLIFEVYSCNNVISSSVQSIEPHISFKFLSLSDLLAGSVKVLPKLVLDFLSDNSNSSYLFENQLLQK